MSTKGKYGPLGWCVLNGAPWTWVENCAPALSVPACFGMSLSFETRTGTYWELSDNGVAQAIMSETTLTSEEPQLRL